MACPRSTGSGSANAPIPASTDRRIIRRRTASLVRWLDRAPREQPPARAAVLGHVGAAARARCGGPRHDLRGRGRRLPAALAGHDACVTWDITAGGHRPVGVRHRQPVQRHGHPRLLRAAKTTAASSAHFLLLGASLASLVGVGFDLHRCEQRGGHGQGPARRPRPRDSRRVVVRRAHGVYLLRYARPVLQRG